MRWFRRLLRWLNEPFPPSHVFRKGPWYSRRMAQRFEFGEPIDEGDTLVLQGVEYHLQPIGIRIMRQALLSQRTAQAGADGKVDTVDTITAAENFLVDLVVPDERDKFREHVENSVDPALLVQMMRRLVARSSDLDPTQPKSSSDGSLPTGDTSTDGAPPTA